jgi:Trk K+ transport system NAD-binding subunit
MLLTHKLPQSQTWLHGLSWSTGSSEQLAGDLHALAERLGYQGADSRAAAAGVRDQVLAGGCVSAPARPPDGRSFEDLDLREEVWISMVIRDAQPMHVRAATVLRAGDEVLVLADPEEARDPGAVFTAPLNG